MAYLVSVSGARIPLKKGQGYLLGRAPECEIFVDDTSCSRNHCRISLSADGGGAALEDLASRNGTLVDGVPVQGKSPLKDGSRISIGATIYLLRMRPDDEDAAIAALGTRSVEQGSLAADLAGGELGSIGLLMLLEALMQSHRNVTLHAATPEGEATVELRGGEVNAASCGGLDGFNALVKLARARSGIFWLVECDGPVDRNVSLSPVRLFVELERCVKPAGGR